MRIVVFSCMFVLVSGLGYSSIVHDYDSLLERYVKNGRVNYSGLKKNDFQTLKNLYEGLRSADPENFLNEQMEIAFWIDAYNLITLYSAVEAYPVKSVRKRRFAFFKKKHEVGGEKLSLEDIENKILRGRFSDPRIHFAVNCASNSCPILLSKSYMGPKVDALLEENAKRFINDPQQVYFDESKGVLYLSKIFSWYQEDFVKTAGSLENYLAGYLASDKRSLLKKKSWKIQYLTYDWGLNESGS